MAVNSSTNGLFFSRYNPLMMYMRICDFLCHDDVIIRLGEGDVIEDLGNVVARCLNDVILHDGQLS